MDTIIKDSLKRSISYQEYRDLVHQMVEMNSTTGHEKTEALTNYTMLNDRRMKRWDKTLKVNEEAQDKTKKFRENVTWLVLTESWCGDAAHILPAMQKIAELNDNIDLKVVLRDENEDLMNAFLTNGNRSIPKLIMIDDSTGEVINTYGPRPSIATQFVNDYKKEHGKLTPEFKEDLQQWYNRDKGQNIIDDLTEKLCELEPSICQ